MIDSSNNLMIPGSSVSPNISFDATNGRYVMSGRSMPEDCSELYERILSWFDNWRQELIKDAQLPSSTQEHVFTFDLDYYNSASGKYIFQVVEQIDKAFMALEALDGKSNAQIKLIWLYVNEDEFMHEAGDEMQDVTEIEIEVKAKK